MVEKGHESNLARNYESEERAMPGFEKLEVGDVVVRMLAGTLPMKLRVSNVTDQVITCSDWEFDRATGAEIDDLLGWGPTPPMTGSYLDPSKTEPKA